MAGERWGRAFFPGVQQVQSCEYTVSHGVLPGIAVLTIAPQRNFEAEGGSLSLFDGTGAVTIPGCKVEKHTIERTEDGYVWRLAILDRRWKWKFGKISGVYNWRDGNGAIVAGTKKSPKELAVLCLLAAGELNFNVDAMTEDPQALPFISWEDDNPMAALEDLAEAYGCRVVYNPIGDSVVLAPTGFGAALPVGPLMEDSLTIDPPERPDSIQIVCGPTRFNLWLALEAVGLDSDNRIKPIDKLTYAPNPTGLNPGDSKWKYEPPPFSGIDSAFRDLARESVFRWYRVTILDPTAVDSPTSRLLVPGVGYLKHVRQILPLEDSQASTAAQVLPEGQVAPGERSELTYPLPPLVGGIYYDGNLFPTGPGPVNEDRPYYFDFAVDGPDGLVKFGNFVFRYTESFAVAPAKLFLLTGVTVRDPDTNAFVKHTRDFLFPDGNQFGTLPLILKKPELRRAVVPEFNAFRFMDVDGQGRPVINDNNEDLNELCDLFLGAAAKQFQQPLPQTVTYAGIMPMLLDGAIQQVTWSIGGGQPARTKASRNTEHQYFLPLHRERRRLTTVVGKDGFQLTLATKNNAQLTAVGASGTGVLSTLR